MSNFPMSKRHVRDKSEFENLLYLYECRIAGEDQYYYYVEGELENIEQLFIHVEME